MNRKQNYAFRDDAATRPDICDDAMLEYLDELQQSGDTNMLGAVPYLSKRFHMADVEAQAVVSYWIKTFAARKGAST